MMLSNCRLGNVRDRSPGTAAVQVLVDGEMRTSFGAVDISQPLRP